MELKLIRFGVKSGTKVLPVVVAVVAVDVRPRISDQVEQPHTYTHTQIPKKTFPAFAAKCSRGIQVVARRLKCLYIVGWGDAVMPTTYIREPLLWTDSKLM